MIARSTILLILFSGLFTGLFAQQDSIRVSPKALGVEDIIQPPSLDKDKVEIISGSRFPVEAGDLPFSSYIITREEIRENGYETLVDALKMVPGIRVSQPGSAIEGETFLMRGLLGNTYAKILINDIPVKPSFVSSLPIGAQLPIREADRIEIIYGAGASLYGSDASAGVINIITKESEKPVFMQADLAIGGGEYSSANVMFGGKLGRNKNIFKYFLYGSNVILEQRNVFYDQEVNYNPDNYPGLTGGDTSYVFFPNYAGTAEHPLLTSTPHMSRKFGMKVNFRDFTLSAETMHRRDHSSIGLNPVAVSYRNPLTYTGEVIQRVNLNFFRNWENTNHKTDFTFLRYRLDERSSILFVQNRLALELANASLARANAISPDSAASLQPVIFEEVYREYLNGSRFMYGNSDEFRLEHVRNYRLLKIFSLTAGANIKYATGYPFTGLLSRPPAENVDLVITPLDDLDFDSTTYPVRPRYVNEWEGNAFGQIFYNGPKVNLAAGLNYANYSEVGSKQDGVLLPRLAGSWKITKKLNLRSSWGRAFRSPNEYFSSNTYSIASNRNELLRRVNSPVVALAAETTTSWESGIRLKSEKKVDFDFTWFINETSNLIKYDRIGGFNADSTVYNALLGYRNSQGSSIRFTGGQFFFGYNFTFENESVVRGQYNFSWINGRVKTDENEANFSLPEYSGRLHQLRLIVRPSKNTVMIFDYLHQRQGKGAVGPGGSKRYGTVDWVGRYKFTERFDAYVKIINVFNKKYAGIEATRTPDDLLYNPQSGFFMRVGMNYFLD